MKALCMALSVMTSVPAAASVPVRRADTSGKFAFVGFGTYQTGFGGEIPLCTFSILRHGLLLTAKHCFTHLGSSTKPVKVKNLSVIFPGLVSLSGSALKEIILDPGPNDIAYVRYEATRTEGVIALPSIKVGRGLPALEAELQMPGFPNAPAKNRKLALSLPCALNGRHDRFPPKAKDAGYEGELWEMACPAWRGQSGSPLIEELDGAVTVYGVLTHTFQVNSDGSIDDSAVETDEFGKFVLLSAYSPLFLAERLDALLEPKDQ